MKPREPGDEPLPAAARLGDLFAALHAAELPLVVRACRRQAHRGLSKAMLAATRAGDGWALPVVVPAAFLVDPVRAKIAFGCAVVSELSVAVVVQGLKALVRRNRPSGDGVRPPVGAPDRWAFPSGHSAHACSVLVLLAWVHPLLGLAALPFALAVGVSRVFFGLHYPSDVIVGAAVGATLAAGTLGAAEATGLTAWLQRMGPFI